MAADSVHPSALDGRHVLVTGGTGSFGNQIVRQLLGERTASITVVSRDEKKQYEMQAALGDQPHLRFLIADVRDLERMREVIRGAGIVFHAAALKQVPNTEYSPHEAVKTNILGAENVRRAAIEAGVEVLVSISTDKAVKPVNVMGMTKAIQERIMTQPLNASCGTRMVCVRYGNVVGSRGSVIPLFHRCIREGKPLPVTHPDMTRFLLTLPEAVRLVLKATVDGENGTLWVRKMPAATVGGIAAAMARGMTGNEDYPVTVVGIRPGEKMHEVLVSEEEMWRAEERDDYFVIPSWAAGGERHGPTGGAVEEYRSDGTRRLTPDEIHALLEGEGWFSPRATDEV